MRRIFKLAAGLGISLALLMAIFAISAVPNSVSAQGPTGTQTPAQAPIVPGPASDNPAAAANLGSAIAALPVSTAEWFSFGYDTSGNAIPRPAVEIRLVNGVQNGLGFQVWSPERMEGGWFTNQPVGQGTQEHIADCTITNDDGTTSPCVSNDLTWVGGFGAPGTYFVRIINNGNSANAGNANMAAGNNGNNNGSVAPILIVSGPGLAQCQTANPLPDFAQLPNGNNAGNVNNSGNATNNGNTGSTLNVGNGQGFSIVQCQNPTPDQLNSLTQMSTSGSSTSAPAAATTVAPTETTAAPAATSAAPAASPSATESATPGASATSESSATPPASMTPEATPSATGTP